MEKKFNLNDRVYFLYTGMHVGKITEIDKQEWVTNEDEIATEIWYKVKYHESEGKLRFANMRQENIFFTIEDLCEHHKRKLVMQMIED
jgi:hypothetical protein